MEGRGEDLTSNDAAPRAFTSSPFLPPSVPPSPPPGVKVSYAANIADTELDTRNRFVEKVLTHLPSLPPSLPPSPSLPSLPRHECHLRRQRGRCRAGYRQQIRGESARSRR